MTDLFSSYGSETAPDRPLKKSEKPFSALEQKMREKQRLAKSFRIWRRIENQHALKTEPRLVDFMRYLKTVGAEQGDELLDAIDVSWLPAAPLNVRIFALRMISARCDRINRQHGREALDDPLPPVPSVYFEARNRLHPGGRH